MEPVHFALNDQQINWINDTIPYVSSWIKHYFQVDAPDPYDPDLLDRLWLRAHADQQRGALTATNLEDVLGLAFGQMLVTRLGFEWVNYKDDYGTTMAVRQPRSGAVSFPFDVIKKRIGTEEAQFNSALLAAFSE